MSAPEPSAIQEWQDLIPYLRAEGPRWHNLAAGMPMENAAVSALVRDAYREAVADDGFARRTARYHGVFGDDRLREQLAALYGEFFSLPLAADHVLVTPGAQAAFHYVSSLVAARGRKVVFFGPEYPGYRTHPDVAYDMLPPVVEERSGNEFRYLPPVGALDSGVGAVVVSRPGNPTGNVIPDEALAALARECADVGALLVVDNAYGPPVPGLAFRELSLVWGENVVLVQSFSKAALAGERAGFVLAAPELIGELASYQARFSIFPPQLVQRVVSGLLRDRRFTEVCARELRPSVLGRHRLAREVLRDTVKVEYRVHTVDGGQFQWIHLPTLRVSSAELFFALRDRGVLVAPSAPFYLPGLRGDEHALRSVRIGVTAPVEAIEQGLTTFAEVTNEFG